MTTLAMITYEIIVINVGMANAMQKLQQVTIKPFTTSFSLTK
jgi:hypothetical protein